MTTAAAGLAVAVFLATMVEMVEALTIVLAMGLTRGWRSALAGTAAAAAVLVVVTAVVGYALATWLPRTALQLVIGVLLLTFGMQWLRKAILRAAGRRSRHDEEAEFAAQTDAAAQQQAGGLNRTIDWFGFVVSFKGVLLEGLEVIFIVITFGLNAHDVPVAVVSAGLGVATVVALGVVVRGPLTRVPENTLKFSVGLLLVTFGSFWSIEGLGLLTDSRTALPWPGGELALLGLLAAWVVIARILVVALRAPNAACDQPTVLR